jgi:hypothetical protein
MKDKQMKANIKLYCEITGRKNIPLQELKNLILLYKNIEKNGIIPYWGIFYTTFLKPYFPTYKNFNL